MTDVIMTFPACSNCTNFIQQIQYFNSLTDTGHGGIIGICILLIVGFVTFFMMKAFEAEKVFSVSMLVTSFLGVLLGFMGLIENNVIYLCLIMLVVSLFLLFKSDRF
jgi:hypothetical protein